MTASDMKHDSAYVKVHVMWFCGVWQRCDLNHTDTNTHFKSRLRTWSCQTATRSLSASDILTHGLSLRGEGFWVNRHTGRSNGEKQRLMRRRKRP